MSTITIKDVPPKTHCALKARATACGRSLNREILLTLERSIGPTVVDAEAILTQARAVRQSISGVLRQADLRRFKAEGRR